MRQFTELRPTPDGAYGVDRALEDRPGVPMEAEPEPAEGVHWEEIPRQPVRQTVLKRRGLTRLTPVFGTSVPPRGISGLMRRVAYRIPEHRARHWLLLLAADRVDVMEGRLGEALARPFEDTPLAPLGRQIQRNPARSIALAALAMLLLRRAMR
ncbi:MAG: hypothetical protein DIU52_012165 [bacterium]|jgi:hypothetical protein|nr:MAG: hypothetical protein DIU52_01300 [bacterium]